VPSDRQRLLIFTLTCWLLAVGTPTWSGPHRTPPGDLKPRYVVARRGTTARRVIVDDVTRPAWTGEAQILLLPEWPAWPADAEQPPVVEFRIMFRVAERRPGSRTTYRKSKLPRIQPPVHRGRELVGRLASLQLRNRNGRLAIHRRVAAVRQR
jgi:hypothetical protein